MHERGSYDDLITLIGEYEKEGTKALFFVNTSDAFITWKIDLEKCVKWNSLHGFVWGAVTSHIRLKRIFSLELKRMKAD